MKRTCGAGLQAGSALATPYRLPTTSPDHLCNSNPRSRFGGTSLRLRQSQQEHGRPCVEATLPSARGDGATPERQCPHKAMTRRARAFIRSASCRRRARMAALHSLLAWVFNGVRIIPSAPFAHSRERAKFQCRFRFRKGSQSFPCGSFACLSGYRPGSGQVCAHPVGSTAKARPPPPG